MAQNKVVIDVEARFVDHLTGEVGKADKAVDNLGKKRPKVVVDAEAKKAKDKIHETEKELDKLGKKKPKPVIDAEDRASKIIDKIADKAESIAKKVYETAVKIHDSEALTYLSNVEEKARGIAGKTWTAVVRIKDMTMAPLRAIRNQLFSLKTLAAGIIGGVAANKYVVQPTLDYANKEDLVTQFAVLLKGKKSKPDYEAANKRIDELTSFAGETPFTRDDIYQASRVLQTYTEGALATPDATGGLRMIGDVAASTGAEYSRVATYFGQLYNGVNRKVQDPGSKLAIGDPLAQLRELGAISAEAEKNIVEIAEGSGTIEERWAKIAAQFSKTDGMMLEMSDQMNNLMLGVKSFFRNNLYMKLGEGITESLKPFLIDFRKWRSENGDLIASWAEQIKDFAAEASDKVLGIVRRTASRANKIMQSDEFQNADIFGKIGMLWKGAIANPFADWWSSTVVPWWESTAVPWLADKAGRLGQTIGGGLSNVLLTILGADVPDVQNMGGEIAVSFVEGFKKSFDGAAVADAFVDAIGRVWDAMPTWAKILVGGYGASKVAGGIQALAGGIAPMAKGAYKLFSGEAGMGLSTAMANFAGSLGAGGGAAGAAGPTLAGAGGAAAGGTMAALGAGAAAGGIVGGATLLSGGYDLYRGFKGSGNEEADKANKMSGGLKIGGVATGAAAGAAIGSVVPVLGTAVGGLIGAGIGGLAGWMGGNAVKKNAAENTESLKALEQQTESNSKATEVMKDKQQALADVLGDVSLSYAEIQEVASNVVTGSMAKKMQEYKSATVSANKALQSFEGSTETLNKLNWKASVGFKFDDDGKAEYKNAVKDYIKNAESVVENEHYEFTAAVSMLIDPKSEEGKGIIKGGDAFYGGLQEQLDKTETKLNKKIKIALKDGEIDADEGAIIEKLQNKVAEITNKLNQAETEAKFEALKIKFGAGAIDSESFKQLQDEIAKQLEASGATYDEALTTSIASLKLQLDEGAIDQTSYDEQIKKLTEGYEANVGELNAKAEKLQLEILGDAINVDPEQLNAGLQQSIEAGIAPMNWSAENAETFLNVSGLTDQAAQGIGTALQSVAESTNMDLSGLQVTGAEAVADKAREQVTTALSKGVTTKTPVTINAEPKVPKKFEGTAADFGVKDSYNFPTATDINAKFGGNKFPGTKSDFGIKDSYDFSTSVNITRNYHYTDVGKKSAKADGEGFRGGLFGGGRIRQFSDGGMVAGGAQLITVAEEGSPEMIIPMSSQRRGRALKLWAQAGHMMRVPGFADGGLVGGNSDEGIRNMQTGGTSTGSAGGGGVQVDVGGVTVEISVTGGGDANVAEAIKAQSGEIADEIAGILYQAFSAQFENTPTKGVA